MNIFYLDENPITAARYHNDKHCIKMILESAQILCTIINEARGEQVTPYKSTHKKHPSTVWAGQSVQHAQWLYDLTRALNDEYKYRFNRDSDHKSFAMLKNESVRGESFAMLKNESVRGESFAMLKNESVRGLLNYYIPDEGFTPPPQAMPDYLKSDDAVFSYRLYYKLEKTHLLQYTKRERPDWL